MDKKAFIIKAGLDMPRCGGLIAEKEKESAGVIFRDCGWADIPAGDQSPQDTVWELCNWPSWAAERPEALHSDIRGCNSDIIVWWEGSPYWAADSVGWEAFGDLDSAKKFMLGRRDCLWPMWPV